MIPALGVSVLAIAVVLQLFDEGETRGAAARRIASTVGLLMVLEGAWVLFRSPGWSGETAATTATHGVAMVAAGVGIGAIAYRALWSGPGRRRAL